MVTLAMRENYEIAPNMSAKAEWVHELHGASVEESRESD